MTAEKFGWLGRRVIQSQSPAGKESSWVQATSGTGYFAALRLCSALEPWFDKTWRPGEAEPVK